jgi:hypothetical protein
VTSVTFVVQEPAAHRGALHPTGHRQALPRPRLLVGRQHRDRIATVRLCLIAQSLHRRPHLLESRTHALALGRVRSRGASRTLGSQGVQLDSESTPALCRSARDGGQSGDLRVGEVQLARVSEKELSRILHCATAGAHRAGARHRPRPHPTARLLRAKSDYAGGADNRCHAKLPFHRVDSTFTDWPTGPS